MMTGASKVFFVPLLVKIGVVLIARMRRNDATCQADDERKIKHITVTYHNKPEIRGVNKRGVNRVDVNGLQPAKPANKKIGMNLEETLVT